MIPPTPDSTVTDIDDYYEYNSESDTDSQEPNIYPGSQQMPLSESILKLAL